MRISDWSSDVCSSDLALDDTGVAERTLVIFTSDNGGKQYSNMAGLARGKGHLWEGGIRVPAFVRWPGVVPSGVTTRQVATTLDWTATILAAAGVTPASSHPLDGLNLLPVLAGGEPIARMIFWRTAQRIQQNAVRDRGWKYLRDEDRDYLLNQVVDPGARNDLTDAEPEIHRRLQTSYAAWDRELLPAAHMHRRSEQRREGQ